jgi:plastocyanin
MSAALLASFQIVNAADITGHIKFNGEQPAETKIPLDPACGKLHDTDLTTSFYVVGDQGELADVFVHLKEGVPDKSYPTPEKELLIDQVGCVYTPYVAGAQTGQTIAFRNSDPVLHNVHPTPTTEGNKEYNKAQLPNGPDLKFSWDNPEIFLRVKCDVHPWMFTYIGLLEHPFHSVSNKKGEFKIKDVPAGDYVVEAYHRKLGKLTKEVKVGDQAQQIDFTFEAKE